MKTLILSMLIALFSYTDFASAACALPEQGVTVVIKFAYLSESGLKFCYADEVNSSNRLEVPQCGFLNVGDRVTGTVYTYSTHNDQQGNPACDYRMFVTNSN